MKAKDSLKRKKLGRQRELAVIDLSESPTNEQVAEQYVNAAHALQAHFGFEDGSWMTLAMKMAMDAGHIRLAWNKGKPGRPRKWSVQEEARLWACVQLLLQERRDTLKGAARWSVKNALDHIVDGIKAGRVGWQFEGWPDRNLHSRYKRFLRKPHVSIVRELAAQPPPRGTHFLRVTARAVKATPDELDMVMALALETNLAQKPKT